ncbi:hypothetical protein RZS08_10240, partial [Arthrospira platensis SPKY1]|nr:hypothetical protein [Arthrospira platensis SPKY1]
YQQETGMDILTNWNIRDLKRNDVPISLESIYFAHHFGVRYARDIYRGQSDKDKLPKGLLNSAVVKANPATERIKTVGDMKRYIKDALDRGIRERNKRMN